jgi:hypothetical protein
MTTPDREHDLPPATLEWGYRLAVLGAVLGVIAGVVQWGFGAEISDWSGDKLHPEQLGLITVALSVVSLAAARVAVSRPRRPSLDRRLLAAGVAVPALICFTTVGRLWYLPGPLLLVAAGLIALASRSERTAAERRRPG